MTDIICVSVGCADTSVVRTVDGTILVDCYRGNEFGDPGDDFVKYLPSSKNLKAVFITHQHGDHFRGLSYLQRNDYGIEYLISSPYKRRNSDPSVTYEEWVEFKGYVQYLQSKGTKLYEPYRQEKWDEPWWNVLGIKIWLLGPDMTIADKETRQIHDASLVVQFSFKVGSCVFAGDASDTELQFIAENTTFGGDILHASHHGSLEGADEGFIKKSNPRHTVISTKAGVHDNVPHPTALARYAKHTKVQVYRTDTQTWTFKCEV